MLLFIIFSLSLTFMDDDIRIKAILIYFYA
nr:MAG TPA: hypothetical protein [Caudoviricetes sp.]